MVDRKRQEVSFPPKAASYFLPVFATGTTAAIFVADTLTGLEIAMPVFYTAVVLMCAGFLQGRGVVLVGLGCIGLTLLSDLLSVGFNVGQVMSETEVINTIISVSAISITTYLALNIQTKATAIYAARAQLTHVARISTLGELTASIAHEINQPLAAILINGNACARWLSSQPPNLHEAKIAVKRIVEETTRAGDIILRVRALTKNVPSKQEWMSVNRAVRDALALADAEIQNNQVTMKVDLADHLPPVFADQVQLQQVILNLILNAIEALSGVPVLQRELVIKTTMPGAAAVSVSVEDSGVGLPAVDVERLFDAFYTTKSNGMGMGLAISRSIAEVHGGRILAKNRAPRGSIFQLELPTTLS